MENINDFKISEKIITKKVVIPSSTKAVWTKWTTEEGLSSFFSKGWALGLSEVIRDIYT